MAASRQMSILEFAETFGVPESGLPPQCRSMIQHLDLRYRPLTSTRQAVIIDRISATIAAQALSVAGPDAKPRWEAGWEDILQRLATADDPVGATVPHYIREAEPLRLNGQYVMATDPSFHRNWYFAFLEWIIREYCQDAAVIYEFGCGSCVNLARMGQIFPGKRYVGLDWTQQAVAIADALGQRFDWNMRGRIFDFFHPDEALQIEEGSVVLTVGALEQTGPNWRPFLDWILRFRPTICVHIEPVAEWYDGTAFDQIARKFHMTRGYWTGFLEALHHLEAAGRAQILKQHRCRLGSLFIEGYSQIIWRPR